MAEWSGKRVADVVTELFGGGVGTNESAYAATTSTDERNFETHPYSPDEQRVVDWLVKRTRNSIGGGPDPIGFLLASYELVMSERNPAKGYQPTGDLDSHAPISVPNQPSSVQPPE